MNVFTKNPNQNFFELGAGGGGTAVGEFVFTKHPNLKRKQLFGEGAEATESDFFLQRI